MEIMEINCSGLRTLRIRDNRSTKDTFQCPNHKLSYAVKPVYSDHYIKATKDKIGGPNLEVPP